MAAAEHEGAVIHVHYDERGLGFFGLGIALATGAPVAIIVTSGTAVGNLLPCIMEAHHSNVALIVLTADRPPELRECGFNQTTDQVKIFSEFVRWQIDLPVIGPEHYFRSTMAESYFHSMKNPPGPVHINCPFADPLYQSEITKTMGRPVVYSLPIYSVAPFHIPYSKGLILIGKLPKPSDLFPILQLAQRLKWPICADILSHARLHVTHEQIRFFDYFEKPTPECVIHFGARMTSKKILEWLEKIKPKYMHISPFSALQDPMRMVTERIQSDIGPFCQNFRGEMNEGWIDAWKEKDREIEFKREGVFTEAHAMREIGEIVPEGFGIFLGNGMPVRDGDHFLFPKKGVRAFFANRGLSGIDGNIATIAGLAEEMPMLGIIGDQASLHDLNSLSLLKKAKHQVILIISNNFGGGMFHYLPVVESPYFEELFAAKHEWRFERVAQMFGIEYVTFEYLREVLGNKKTAIVELFTDRYENHMFQKRLSISSLPQTVSGSQSH